MTRMCFAGAFGLLLLVQACTTALVPDARSERKRIALVIGNAKYKYLDQLGEVPRNDAWGVSKLLKELKFKVFLKYDLNRTDMQDSIKRFISLLSKETIGLFYYSGHAIQVGDQNLGDQNYLIPVNGTLEGYADFPKPEQLEKDFIRLDPIVLEMGAAESQNIIILDACRDNPFAHYFKSPMPPGLAPPKTSQKGTLIAYAAAAMHKSSSKPSEHGYSIYTDALIEEIRKSGQNLSQVLNTVRQRVSEKSDGKQEPNFWNDGFPPDFVFNTKSSDLLKPQPLRDITIYGPPA